MQSEKTRTIAVHPERIVVTKYSLEVLRGPCRGLEKTFGRRLVQVGSAPECPLVIDDPTISRTHFSLEVDHLGHRLRDLDSKNGTFVEGCRIQDAYLPKTGARIAIGNTELMFRTLGETVEVQLSRESKFGEIIGRSAAMREIFALLTRLSPTDVTILLEGESGTGKELVAEAIHSHSPRANNPFVIFDCSAVAENLIESELFGHVKGAFTGASASREGAFIAATGGTLFLDEISELGPDLQPRLLRALEKREIKPVGSNRHIQADVRIVAATNRNLEVEVRNGNFREDLYYRLAVVPLRLPPLKERAEDIPLLVSHFLKSFGHEHGREVRISFETMAKLQQHSWPGNVRELKNFVERAAVLSDDGHISTRYIDERFTGALERRTTGHSSAVSADDTSVGTLTVDLELPFKDAKARLTEEFERLYWRRHLEAAAGNISLAARRTGIHRKSLEYLLRKLDITPAKKIE